MVKFVIWMNCNKLFDINQVCQWGNSMEQAQMIFNILILIEGSSVKIPLFQDMT